MKRKLAVDIDNTLWDLITPWLEIYNSRYSDNVVYDMITNYNFYDTIKLHSTKEELFNIIKESSIWFEVKPYEYTYEYLEKLNKEFELYIVTNTSYKTSKVKFYRLFKLFPFLDDSQLVTIKDKHLLNVDIMIDDCIDYLYLGNYIKILVDAPYNRNDNRLDDSFIRVNNLKEAYEIITEG